MNRLDYDCCIVGGGSGGLGAALAAARAGLRVALVERNACLGGNAVHGGVHSWAPGVGGAPYSREIYERLAAQGAAAVWSYGRHCCWPGGERFPGGECVVDRSRGYEATQRRYGSQGIAADEHFCRETWHGVVFEPLAYATVVAEMLSETGCCDVLTGWRFVEVQSDAGVVKSIVAATEDGEYRRVAARFFVDATADVRLCRAAGCDVMLGEDSKADFGESGAPDERLQTAVNAATLIYRVAKKNAPSVDPLGDGYEACPWRPSWPFAEITHYPNGDLNVNMLPTMDGVEFLRFVGRANGYLAAYNECRRRILGHWHWMQSEFEEFRIYGMRWIAPSLGVRESCRVRGDYVLTQRDLTAGLHDHKHPDIVAIADHAMDIHGERSQGIGELAEPYGIPYRCLLPCGLNNVAVACRGASFSHIAASSCRLSRTMLSLGIAAGTAVAIASGAGCSLRFVPPETLQASLRRLGVSI